MPDLRRLLVTALGEEPGAGSTAGAAGCLTTAAAQRLPLAQTAEALGLADEPGWQSALAEERACTGRRDQTVRDAEAALGELASSVALGGATWRPSAGADVDLLVPGRLLDEVGHRLADAGFAAVGWHDETDRRALVRIEDGVAVDLVDVEVVPEVSVQRGSGRCFGRLSPDEAAARLRRAVAARGVVRLVDLADAEELGMAPDDLSAGPRGPVVPEPRGRSLRVALTGPEAEDSAAALATSLRVAALDVVELRRPSALALAKGVARGIRDSAVVVVADPGELAIRLLRPSLRFPGGRSPKALDAALRRVLGALGSPAAQSAGRRA